MSLKPNVERILYILKSHILYGFTQAFMWYLKRNACDDWMKVELILEKWNLSGQI